MKNRKKTEGGRKEASKVRLKINKCEGIVENKIDKCIMGNISIKGGKKKRWNDKC